jgi:hypothetical protein
MTLSARRDLAAPSKFFASARLRAETIPVEVIDHAAVYRGSWTNQGLGAA